MPSTPNPNAGFPEQFLDAAALIADPSIAGVDRDTDTGAHVYDYRLRAARCQVRRIVAALNGVDVEHDLPGTAAQRLDSLAVVPRALVAELRQALLNDAVVNAMESATGAERAAVLLGQISLLE